MADHLNCNGINGAGEQTCKHTIAAAEAAAAGWKVNLFGTGMNYCPHCLGGNRRAFERVVGASPAANVAIGGLTGVEARGAVGPSRGKR